MAADRIHPTLMIALLALAPPAAIATDWDWCGPPPAGTPIERAPLAVSGPLQIEADRTEFDGAAGEARFSGTVEIQQGVQRARAERALVDRASGWIELDGSVELERPELEISADRLTIDQRAGTRELEQLRYRTRGHNARGEAARARIDDRGHSRFEAVSYTTCRPGDDAWLLRAESLETDRASGRGVARDATLRLGGVPLFYAPYLSFPIDDRRQSGFLVPSFGSSSRRGLEVATPYYINIAPNLDATLTPRLLSKRGAMLGGELRYLTPLHHGTVEAEILPDDGDRNPDQPGTRGLLHLDHRTRWSDRLDGEILFTHVSDDTYFEDFARDLAGTSVTQLEQRAELRYRPGRGELLARVQRFQTLDPDLAAADRPYSRLPQLRYHDQATLGPAGLALTAEYARFSHDSAVDGQRVALAPRVRLPLIRAWGYLTPTVALDYRGYRLDSGAGPREPDLLLPSLSFDAGLAFERHSGLFGGSLQTLEPRLYYLYRPYERQDDQPLFDSDDLTFGFDALFRDNRFSGLDRLGDANQLALAVTSDLLDPASGRERARFAIGQIVHFRDRRVTLDGTPDRRDSSPLALLARLRPLPGWTLSAELAWDPAGDGGRFERGRFRVQYRGDGRRIASLDLRAAEPEGEQAAQDVDLALFWPLGGAITAIGRWDYSTVHARTMELLGGLEFGRCCWRVRALVRSHVIDPERDPDLGILLQLELRGLTRMGDPIEGYLREGIPGYQDDD